MSIGWDEARSPLTAMLCDLRPRFIAKGMVGRGFRAVSRNGRVLLCSDRPLAELAGKTARVRLQTWNRSIVPGDAPAPYGVLLCIRCTAVDVPAFSTRLTEAPDGADLALDVGGLQVLAFRRIA